jgi:hypothetical protein
VKTPSEKRAIVRKSNQKFAAVVRATIREAKGSVCQDCGGTFPDYVLEFDHVRGEKSFTISQFISTNGSFKRLPLLHEEIAKCDVVCANCHRIREHERGWAGFGNVTKWNYTERVANE